MSARQVVVATHGHCFDGMASAALFAALLGRIRGQEALTFRFLSCGYGPTMSQVPPYWLDGDENAILDFRYTKTKRLSWYFDHHATAFASPEERDEALGSVSADPTWGPQVYHDGMYGSCAKLIADTSARVYGVRIPHLEDLVTWADRIDTASFESAEAALRRDEPALQLAGVVEQHGDRPFLENVVPKLVERGLHEVAAERWVGELWAPIAAAHAALVERIRARARLLGRVVLTDLSEAPVETPPKFISYALFPGHMYSVTLIRAKQCFKLAVGFNPWCGTGRLHDISAICRQYGGGGHPVVGAATFRLGDEALARAAAEAVAALLAE